MRQRKCGSCRYFEEGGIAASGWCRHPDRQDLQHMVLVRKTELACRDGWDQDLWEPRKASERHGEPTGFAASNGGDISSAHQDREAGIPSPGQPLVDDPTDRVGATVESRAIGENLTNRAFEESRTISDYGAGSASSPRSSSFPSQDPFYSDSHIQHDQLTQEVVSMRNVAGSPGQSVSRHPDQDDTASDSAIDSGLDSDNRNVVDATLVRVNLRQPEAPLPDIRDLIPKRVDGSSQVASHDELPRFGMFPESQRESFSSEPVIQSGHTEPFGVIDEEFESEPEAAEDVDGEAEFEDFEDFADSSDVSIGSSNGNGIRIPAAIHHEQRCRTCRDFRPSEHQDRGWCNNPFAFDQRTLVPADGLACRGTCGSWWTPADDWWMERADISHHAAPTPNVENLIRSVLGASETRVDVRHKKGVI